MRIALNLLLLTAFTVSSAVPVFAQATVASIDAQQAKLMQDINKSQKTKELTAKQCNKMRSDLADLVRKKTKFKKKQGGKMSEADIATIQEDLNKITLELSKAKLDTRLHTEKPDTEKKPDKKKKD